MLVAGGMVAGRFRLLQPLGSGGIGTVWMVEDAGGQRLALKLAGEGETAATLLHAGFEQARALVHPGILRPLEWLPGPPAAMLMPCVEGGDLGALRGAGWQPILAALAELAETLDHVHRQGIVHRDLKPANVLRDRHGRWLLSDFGSGAWQHGGTLPYMSPQQVDGQLPAVADDIYGLGALAVELLGGQPPFHPGASAERIRTEAAPVPHSDLAGASLPPSLRLLLAAMLDKDAAHRPVSAAALRAAFLELLAAAGPAPLPILPVERRAAATPSATAVRKGLPATVVYGGLLALLALAVLVIAYLPGWMQERAPAAVPATPVAVPAEASPPVAAPAPAAAAETVSQAAVDAALGEFLRLDDELGKAGAERWAGADWGRLREQAQLADAAYRGRDLAAALEGYRAATVLARTIQASAPQVLAAALAAGEAALRDGQQAAATAAFTQALAVAPADAGARRGLERAARLDQLLGLLGRATTAEAAGQRSQALALYREAAQLDPASSEAAAGFRRLSQEAARETYETQMARGLAEQAAGRPAAARTAYAAALQARPGDAAAGAALAQLDADQELARLATLQAQAEGFAQTERWAEALQAYERLQAAGPQLVAASEGVARARSRSELDSALRRELASADLFNDDAVLARARATLEAAREVTPAGPVLAGQLAELEQLLAVAIRPVPVVLESDNLTEVTLFKVGRLGSFASRTLELRPGLYTVVGARPGYRDVRRQFRVLPDGERTPVVVRCEDAI